MNKKNKAAINPINLELLGKPRDGVAYCYEECIPVVDIEIKKRKPRWLLNRISWIDYDDVSQIIRSHIFEKWYQWEQDKPLLNWVNAIISNQTRNIIRNIYTSYVKPCVQCPANEGGDLCRIYGTQCSSCEVYKKWEKTKKRAQAINLAESFEDMEETLKSQLTYKNHFPNYNLEKLHGNILPKLTPIQQKVYKLLYIENLDELDVAREMGYKTREKSRSPGYKQIEKFKKIFIKTAKQVIEETEIF